MRFVRRVRSVFVRPVARRIGQLAVVLMIGAGGAAAIAASGGKLQALERYVQNVAPAPGAAQSGAPEKVDGGQPAWTVSCFSRSRSAAPDCRVQQRLFVKETGRMMSDATIDIPGNTRRPTLLMQLPNGLSIRDGVSLAVDGGAGTALQLQSCDGNGCYAVLVLTPELIDTMKKGKVMAVKAVAANGQTLVFQHLLTDFATAFEAAK